MIFLAPITCQLYFFHPFSKRLTRGLFSNVTGLGITRSIRIRSGSFASSDDFTRLIEREYHSRICKRPNYHCGIEKSIILPHPSILLLFFCIYVSVLISPEQRYPLPFDVKWSHFGDLHKSRTSSKVLNPRRMK